MFVQDSILYTEHTHAYAHRHISQTLTQPIAKFSQSFGGCIYGKDKFRLSENHSKKATTHSPGAHPRQSPSPTMKRFPLQPVGKGLGMCSGSVCWNNLRIPHLKKKISYKRESRLINNLVSQILQRNLPMLYIYLAQKRNHPSGQIIYYSSWTWFFPAFWGSSSTKSPFGVGQPTVRSRNNLPRSI